MKKEKLVYIIILLMPIIDLISSITSRILPNIPSLGVLFKGLLILVIISYVLFISKSKYRKVSIYYFMTIFIYIIFYFIYKTDLLTINILTNELNYLFKFIYFPIVTFGLLNYFSEYKFDKNKLNKVMIISFISYITLIILPTLFNVNFTSYSNSNYYGSVGWFYSANEVSTILLLMFPFIFTLLEKNKILTIILFGFGLYAISLIGTKVTLFGIIIIMFLLTISSIIKNKKFNTINNYILCTLFVITILFMNNNYSAINMKSSLSQEEVTEIENISKELEDYYEENELLNKFKEIGSKLLSSRDVYALNTYKIYDTSYDGCYILFGMGFSNTDRINNERVEKLIEIDFLDIIFHMGFIALLILAFPFIYVFIKVIKNRKKYSLSTILFLGFTILMCLGISSVAGHVFIAPAVSLYIAIYFNYLFYEVGLFKRKKINENKITLLALHMGYGGVENAVANQSSMLSHNYEVEIISLYKQKYDIPFNLDNNVKVTYLMNIVSNKKEFMDALKKKNIVKVIKEGLKSIYILLRKESLVINAIRESDAKIIISTRYEFSELLSKYKNRDIISIHEEHTFNIDSNYIEKLNNLKLDYIMPSSMYLTKIYKKKMGRKVKYIPLSLNYYPSNDELSLLNNKNLIAIGRLEKVKGFEDLIDVMNEVVKQDKDVKLNIFGDGALREVLQNKIDNLALSNNITLWGFKDQVFIKSYLKTSSLYVLTSHEESFGLVVLEAMSYGIPCIMFDSAKGTLELVNKDNGYIIKGRNKKKMAQDINNYLKLNNKKKIGTEARRKTINYTYDEVQKEWLEFINIIMKG